MIKPVISKMFQTYTTAHKSCPDCSLNSSVSSRMHNVSFQGQGDIVEINYPKHLTEEEIKRRALTEYIISGMKTDNVELDDVPTFRELLDKPALEIITSCGGDLAKINKLTGHYGLVKYAAFTSTKNKDFNIYESVADSFSDYLLHNHKGSVKDLYQIYGECGKIMYKGYSNLGFLRQDHDKNYNLTYCTTPSFLNTCYYSNNLCHMK